VRLAPRKVQKSRLGSQERVLLYDCSQCRQTRGSAEGLEWNGFAISVACNQRRK
jgi:hypothetical protein